MKRLLVTTVATIVCAVGLVRAGEQAKPISPTAPVARPKARVPTTRGLRGGVEVRPQTPTQTSPRMLPAHAVDTTADAQTAMVKQYCVTCHNERGKAGGLSLASFDA